MCILGKSDEILYFLREIVPRKYQTVATLWVPAPYAIGYRDGSILLIANIYSPGSDKDIRYIGIKYA
jgi:hypothetical protein